jgi:hypothetical protein
MLARRLAAHLHDKGPRRFPERAVEVARGVLPNDLMLRRSAAPAKCRHLRR